MSGSIAAEVAEAMIRCRQSRHLELGHMVRDLNRLVPRDRGSSLDIPKLEAIERGREPCDAVYLVAAARLLGQSVSALLGEEAPLRITLPELAQQVEALRRLVEDGGKVSKPLH